MSDNEIQGTLKNDFLLISEMENIEGLERCIGGTLCDYLYKITFELPETMTEVDWLTFLVSEVKNKHNKLYVKITDLKYTIDYPKLPSEYDDHIEFYENTGKYEFRTFWSE